MPNIQTYEAPTNLGLQPTEIGVTAFEQAGNRIGRFFNQAAGAATEVGNQFARGVCGDIEAAAGVVADYVQHKNVSDLAAAGVKAHADMDTTWNTWIKGNGKLSGGCRSGKVVDRFGIEPKLRGWETYWRHRAPAQVGRGYLMGHRCPFDATDIARLTLTRSTAAPVAAVSVSKLAGFEFGGRFPRQFRGRSAAEFGAY